MASKTTEDTIEAFLRTQWPHSAECPIQTENLGGETPENGGGFLVLEFPVAQTERLSTGSRKYREWGGFRIQINVERGSGADLMRTYGDEIAAMFRDVQIGPVHCTNVTTPGYDIDNDQGTVMSKSVVVEFWRCFAA